MSSSTITIHFSSGDKTYGLLREGWALPSLVGAKGNHATQSLSLSILSKEAFALFLCESQRLLKAEVKRDSSLVFEGVVRPYLGASAKGTSESPIAIEVLDYTELLHFRVDEDSVLQNMTLDKVIDALFSLAGVSIAREYPSSFTSDATLRIPLTQGEYVDDILSTLLSERGFDYRFVPGGCQFFSTSIEDEPSTSIDDIRGTLSVSRSDDWSDGLEVSYMRAKEDDLIIYRHEREETNWRAVGGSEFSFPGGTSMLGAKGLYYDSVQHPQDPSDEPPANKAAVAWNIRYNEPAGTEIKPIGIADVKIQASLGDEDGVSLTPHVKDVSLSGGRVWVSYSGNFNYHEIPVASWFSSSCRWSWIWRITVTAHIAYLTPDSASILTETGIRPEQKRNLKYIYNEAMAEAYVKREAKRQKTASLTYSFSSMTCYTAGGFYKLTDSVTGIDTVVRVLSCTEGADGVYTVKAESAGTMDISEVGLKRLYASDMEASPDTSFRILASKTTLSIASDVASLSVAGVVAAADGMTFRWMLGDVSLGEGLAIELRGSDLVVGTNHIVAKAIYQNTEMAEAYADISYIQGAKGDIGERGYGIVASVSRPSFTEASWNTYGTIGHEENWENTSSIRNGCRIGDLFLVVGTATDTGRAHTLTYRSTTASGDLKGVCIAHSSVDKGAKGDTGAKGDSDVFRLVVVSSESEISVRWDGKAMSNGSVELELQNTLTGAAVAWTAMADGTYYTSLLKDVEGNPSRKRLEVSASDPAAAKSCILVSVSCSVDGKEYSDTYAVKVSRQASPSPKYCGTLSAVADSSGNPVDNLAREERSFAYGDYFLFVGETTVSDLSNTGTFESTCIYEYRGRTEGSTSNAVFYKSNTSEHTFGAMEDLVDEDQNADSQPMQVMRNLVANTAVFKSILTKYLTVESEIDAAQLKLRDDGAVAGIYLSKEGLECRDASGNVMFAFRSDGTGTLGTIEAVTARAKSIEHDALKTSDAVSLSNSATLNAWSGEKHGWLNSDVYTYATKKYAPAIYSDSTYKYGDSAVKGCIATIAGWGPAVSETVEGRGTDPSTAKTALEPGKRYKHSQSVSAGDGYWLFHRHIGNSTDRPVYVHATCGLPGNMNEIYVEVWSQDSSPYKMKCGTDAHIWLHPGQSVGVYAHSWAWWGTQTGWADFTVHSNDGYPWFYGTYDTGTVTANTTKPSVKGDWSSYFTGSAANHNRLYWGFKSEVAESEVSGSPSVGSFVRWCTMFTATLPFQNSKAVIRFAAVRSKADGWRLKTSKGDYIDPKTRHGSYDYYFELDTTRVTSVSLEAKCLYTVKKETGSVEDDDGNTSHYTYYTEQESQIYVESGELFFEVAATVPAAEGVHILLADGSSKVYTLGQSGIDDRDGSSSANVKTLSIAGFISGSHLTRVNSYKLANAIKAVGGVGKFISTDSSKTNTVSFQQPGGDSTTYTGVTEVSARSNGSVTVAHANGTNEVSGWFSSLSCSLYLVGSVLGVNTKDVLPMANEKYSIGSTSNRYQNVYAKNFTGHLEGTVNSQGTPKQVWGAVFN